MLHLSMIYLLGTRHTIQTESKESGPKLSAKYERFKKYVADAACSNTVAAIAEETNYELEEQHGRKSIARLVAESMDPPLQYLPCELNRDERRALGILTGDEVVHSISQGVSVEAWTQHRDAELLKYFPIREKFWIENLRRLSVQQVLFVCGPDHMRTFSCRLIENSIPCQIICFDWWALDDEQHGVLPFGETPL